MTFLNSIEYFLDNFELYNDKTAIVWRKVSYTYSQLLSRINHWRGALKDISPGTIVGL